MPRSDIRLVTQRAGNVKVFIISYYFNLIIHFFSVHDFFFRETVTNTDCMKLNTGLIGLFSFD